MALPDKPLTRRETYLAKAAGQEVTLPEEDITREEMYLRAIAEGGGGGGVTPEYVAEAIAEAKTDIEAEIPTKTSDLTNDSGYAAIDDTTAAQNKTYSSAKIDKITVELTQAEYDALTEEEKNNGTIYFITDAQSGITIDSELSTTSTNAVQNSVITLQVNKISSEAEIQAQINDHIYQGTDLTVKFASEVSASPYNGDPWAWIKSRITAGDFTGIHIYDYIPITTTNNVTLNAQIAGINTYKNYGDSAVGSHIDFICKELWPTLHPINKVNYNNGTADQQYPWLASDLYLYLNSLAGTVPSEAVVGGGEGTAVDYTADGVYYFLPTQLKNVIIEKRFLLPKRYSASGLLSDDNSWGWVNIGKLWIPDECEVYGVPVWGGKGGYSLGGSGLQYPLFAGNMNRLKFRNGGRHDWWLLSPYSGNSTHWCYVTANGGCAYGSASVSGIAAPVCFRVG